MVITNSYCFNQLMWTKKMTIVKKMLRYKQHSPPLMGNMREKKRCKKQSKKFNLRDPEREKKNGKREVTRENYVRKFPRKGHTSLH